MSRRALRRLRGEQRGQEGPGLGQLGIDTGSEHGPERARQAGPPPDPASRPRAALSNRFELVRADRAGAA
ncbi:hypothetical protein WISP_00309 [Willisornis vidua]|uniref:Uncharacterized protein n=1 Tax=Willisornis vidua TaxID=1566151 RepID=A0ABQ9E014_9PASS|nr:hypothetical protein WISP_00309 [Willisornis vidua]